MRNQNIKQRKVLLKKLIQQLRKEMKCMCSKEVHSVLQDKSAKILAKFSWESLISELAVSAPILLQVLRGCTMTRNPHSNRDATIGMCAAILLKFRLPTMSLVQRILSLILYAGHSAKMVCYCSDLEIYTCMNLFIHAHFYANQL